MSRWQSYLVPTPTTIVPATDALLSDCLRFDHHVAGGSTERQATLTDAAEQGRMRVAVVDGRGVAYSIVAPWFFGEPFLAFLYVDAELRGRGIGEQLLSEFEEQYGPTLFTSTNLSNARMQALLRKRDWSPRGMLHWLDDDDPEVFFAKVIS
jgi:ribosomal protein S18 acetylase RimI-like enzyme